MPANWRADCPHECEVRISSQRDSAAAGLRTTPHCLTLIPARRVPARGVVVPKRIKVGGTTKRTMCVVCGLVSKADAQPRNAVRSVASAVPSCQPRRVGDFVFHCGRKNTGGESRQREAKISDSSTAERSARTATRWAHGRGCKSCAQSGGEVSDQSGFASGVGQFRKRSLRSAAKAGPSPRLLLMPCPCEASRAIAAVFGDRRSLAPYC